MHFRYIQYLLLLSVFSFVAFANAADKKSVPTVVVSIKPLALIYAALQPEHVSDVQILIPAERNLHDYALSVKDLKRLHGADTLFWLGADSEPFIAKVQKRFSGNKQWIAVAESSPHGWLDVAQLQSIVDKMVNALIVSHPQDKPVIELRGKNFMQSVKQRQAYWQQQLQPSAEKPFLLGHSGFVAFANNIGLKHAELYLAGHSHGHAQGGMHELLEIQKHLSEGEITCALQEPEVDFGDLAKRYPQLKLGYIEPMARQIKVGQESYVQFFDATAKAFQQCLKAGE